MSISDWSSDVCSSDLLPLVPGYLSFVAGGAVAPTASPMEVRLRRWRTLGLSACFVLGFSSVFLILGASITAIGRLFLSYRYELNIAAGDRKSTRLNSSH